MADIVYQDEGGSELWRSSLAERVPPGTMVTAVDGTRYLVVKVASVDDPDGGGELRITLHLYRT